jgi:LmbE family N-acetylglucosaminyl deacetylase
MGNYPAKRHFLAAITAPVHSKRRARSAAHLPQLRCPGQGDVIICLAPHPDDEVIFTGALLADAISAGATVHIVLVTDGNAQGRTKARREEFLAATASLGIPESHCHFLDFPDGSLHTLPPHALEHALLDVLNPLQPTHLFAPHPADRHRDHAAVAVASIPVSLKLGTTLYGYLSHFPPTFPLPRAHREELSVVPPRSLKKIYHWVSYPVSSLSLARKRAAMKQYTMELGRPVLRSLFLAFLRQNELFADLSPERR